MLGAPAAGHKKGLGTPRPFLRYGSRVVPKRAPATVQNLKRRALIKQDHPIQKSKSMSNRKHYPMRFTGAGGEYFVIWIVNIALTLVTLGIYSAWAKVRTQRWFYGHTLFDNQAFSYLARPIQILKGRLIALAALVAYYTTSYFAPMLALVLLLAFFIAMPWIVVSSLRFRARMSAYRGLRFDFTGKVGEAAVIYVLLPLLILPTLGLILPYMAYRQVKFIASNTVYGQTPARYEGSVKPFWGVYLLAFALLVLPFMMAYGFY